MRRSAVVPVLLAVLTGACGGGAAVPSTTPAVPPGEGTAATTATDDTGDLSPAGEPGMPADHPVAEADDGTVLAVHPGDTITVKLPVEDPANPLWVIALEPDPAVVETGGAFPWTPADPGDDGRFFQFVFRVTGIGDTGITFSLGPPGPDARTFGFTVRSEAP